MKKADVKFSGMRTELTNSMEKMMLMMKNKVDVYEDALKTKDLSQFSPGNTHLDDINYSATPTETSTETETQTVVQQQATVIEVMLFINTLR